MSTPARPSDAYELHIDVVQDEGRHRVSLKGELDLASASALQEAVGRVLAQRPSELVLDIGELTFIDSTGLRAILTSRAEAERQGADFSIAPAAEQVRPQVRRLLQVTGLLERLPFDAPSADA